MGRTQRTDKTVERREDKTVARREDTMVELREDKTRVKVVMRQERRQVSKKRIGGG